MKLKLILLKIFVGVISICCHHQHQERSRNVLFCEAFYLCSFQLQTYNPLNLSVFSKNVQQLSIRSHGNGCLKSVLVVGYSPSSPRCWGSKRNAMGTSFQNTKSRPGRNNVLMRRTRLFHGHRSQSAQDEQSGGAEAQYVQQQQQQQRETSPCDMQQQDNSRSTFSYHDDKSIAFHQGFQQRKERIDKELVKIGIQPDKQFSNLLQSGISQGGGTAALRAYSSFIFPKSMGALAMTQQPQRATVIANHIAFLIKEQRSHEKNWMRNHDRAIKEVEQMEGTEGLAHRNPIILVLDNIRSAHNVGNIIRAAEAAKCSMVLLCGSMTPAPPHPKVLKTALGSAEYVPYKKYGSTLQAIRDLKEQDIKVVGVETTSKSLTLWDYSIFHPHEHQMVAFVFGNEIIGVDTECLEECDALVALPTHGIKNSLNVATCVSAVGSGLGGIKAIG
jgi:tRNA G18 (ribose-2'-O)-methylase SpoU